jgi:chaperone modulatory protein CbpM
MEPQLITITQYCIDCDVEQEFIDALEESGIISFAVVDTERYIREEQLNELERYIQLHYELRINIEGIDAIRHLLVRVDNMQKEIKQLKNRLHIQQ